MSEVTILMGLEDDPRNRTRNDRSHTPADSFTPPIVANPDVDYEDWTVADLKAQATQMGISVPSRWRKADIIEALENA